MTKIIENELPKIRVVLRDDRPVNAEGKQALNYFVRFAGKTLKKPAGLYLPPKDWNKKKGLANGSSNEILRIEKLLNEKKADFTQYILNFTATGGQVTRNVIDDYFEDRRYDDFFSFYSGVVKKRDELSKPTRDKYALCLTTLKKFCKKNKMTELRFSDFRLGFVTDFDKYLVHTLSLSSDTANNYHKCLKYVLNQALLDEIIHRSPYLGFKPVKTKSKKTVSPLTQEEVIAIGEVEIPEDKPHLERVRDCFVFMLNTGIRYSDLFELRTSDLVQAKQEGKTKPVSLRFVQKKTKNPVVIPLNPKSRNLIEKYRKVYELDNGVIFPKISNQVFNRHLKDLADLAEVTKNVHCHLSRHTFASTLRRLNVSLENVSELLGHTDIKMTKIYAKSDLGQLTEAVNLL